MPNLTAASSLLVELGPAGIQDRICQQPAAHRRESLLGLLPRQAAEGHLHVFSDPDVGPLAVTELVQAGTDRLALGIEHTAFQRDVDASLQETASRAGRRKHSTTMRSVVEEARPRGRGAGKRASGAAEHAPEEVVDVAQLVAEVEAALELRRRERRAHTGVPLEQV